MAFWILSHHWTCYCMITAFQSLCILAVFMHFEHELEENLNVQLQPTWSRCEMIRLSQNTILKKLLKITGKEVLLIPAPVSVVVSSHSLVFWLTHGRTLRGERREFVDKADLQTESLVIFPSFNLPSGRGGSASDDSFYLTDGSCLLLKRHNGTLSSDTFIQAGEHRPRHSDSSNLPRSFTQIVPEVCVCVCIIDFIPAGEQRLLQYSDYQAREINWTN